jgi:hypothetical protein
MRLAFDLDGTVADMQRALAREARELFPELDPATLPRSFNADAQSGSASPPPADAADAAAPPVSADALSPRQMKELWRTVRARTNWWETLDEIEPGALARLYELVQRRRWEVIFITSRPETEGDTAQMQSHRWLARCGFTSPSVFVVHGSRGKIATALAIDVVVDDRPENCLDVAIDSAARPILVWRGDEEKVPASARQLGIGAVTSIADVLDILEALDAEAHASGLGMVDRLKSLLGLKTRRSRVRNQAASPTATA